MQDADRASLSAGGTAATSQRGSLSSESVDTGDFDLTAYARKHRYRLRNLHKGHAVPPARRTKSHDPATGYTGQEDRCDAIVGYDGYICDEGAGQLGFCLFYRSARGVKRAEARIRALGGTVTQIGDTEIAGTIPLERIEEALKLIRVSKLHPGNPNPTVLPRSTTRTGARIA